MKKSMVLVAVLALGLFACKKEEPKPVAAVKAKAPVEKPVEEEEEEETVPKELLSLQGVLSGLSSDNLEANIDVIISNVETLKDNPDYIENVLEAVNGVKEVLGFEVDFTDYEAMILFLKAKKEAFSGYTVEQVQDYIVFPSGGTDAVISYVTISGSLGETPEYMIQNYLNLMDDVQLKKVGGYIRDYWGVVVTFKGDGNDPQLTNSYDYVKYSGRMISFYPFKQDESKHSGASYGVLTWGEYQERVLEYKKYLTLLLEYAESADENMNDIFASVINSHYDFLPVDHHSAATSILGHTGGRYGQIPDPIEGIRTYLSTYLDPAIKACEMVVASEGEDYNGVISDEALAEAIKMVALAQ